MKSTFQSRKSRLVSGVVVLHSIGAGHPLLIVLSCIRSRDYSTHASPPLSNDAALELYIYSASLSASSISTSCLVSHNCFSLPSHITQSRTGGQSYTTTISYQYISISYPNPTFPLSTIHIPLYMIHLDSQCSLPIYTYLIHDFLVSLHSVFFFWLLPLFPLNYSRYNLYNPPLVHICVRIWIPCICPYP